MTITARASALSLVLLSLAFAPAVARQIAQSSASPSGTGIQDRSPTTGTANYPTDPRASSPSSTGNNRAGNASNRAAGTHANNNNQEPSDAEKRGNGQSGADATTSGSDR
jgi:hypothetical protein